MDGLLETTEQIRSAKANGSIPSIAIASYAMSGNWERLLAARQQRLFGNSIALITAVGQIHTILGVMAKGN